MTTSPVERVWGRGGARLLAGDAAVVGLLAASVVALAAPRGATVAAARAEVEVSGRHAATLDLARASVSSVDGPLGATRLEVRDGGVRVLSSPCPRQACRHAGWIREPGELLVCLPNAVVVRLPGKGLGAVDGVSR